MCWGALHGAMYPPLNPAASKRNCTVLKLTECPSASSDSAACPCVRVIVRRATVPGRTLGWSSPDGLDWTSIPEPLGDRAVNGGICCTFGAAQHYGLHASWIGRHAMLGAPCTSRVCPEIAIADALCTGSSLA